MSSAWPSGSAHPPLASASELSHLFSVWTSGRSSGSPLCCLPGFPGASGSPGPLDRELPRETRSQGFPPPTTKVDTRLTLTWLLPSRAPWEVVVPFQSLDWGGRRNLSSYWLSSPGFKLYPKERIAGRALWSLHRPSLFLVTFSIG